MLVQCGDMAPPAFGEPPESTSLPTTKECEASSVWEKEWKICRGSLKISFPERSDVHLEVKYARGYILSKKFVSLCEAKN